MPRVLKEDLREAAGLVILEFAKSKYPEYSNQQLSSIFKRAMKKVRTSRTVETA
jgi:hypothetical protein